MNLNEKLPAKGYVVIRCHDRALVARFDSFPLIDLNLTTGNVETSMLINFSAGVPVSGFWLRDDEFVTSLNGLDEARIKAGLPAVDYRRTAL